MSVKRADKWEGKFGRGKILQMLTGSKSQEILKSNLDQLTTYGILKDAGTATVNELLKHMHDAALIYTQKGEFPLVTLTPLGESVMLGKSEAMMIWPKSKSLSEKSSAKNSTELEIEEIGFDPKLYDALKTLRARIAKQESIPVHMVFPNKTLEYFTRLRPKTLEAGLRIKGVGEVKAARYLEQFIEVIRNYR